MSLEDNWVFSFNSLKRISYFSRFVCKFESKILAFGENLIKNSVEMAKKYSFRN